MRKQYFVTATVELRQLVTASSEEQAKKVNLTMVNKTEKAFNKEDTALFMKVLFNNATELQIVR
jgi:hypothetical protein